MLFCLILPPWFAISELCKPKALYRFSLFMHFLHFPIGSCALVAQRNVDSVDFRSVLSSRRGRESMRWIGGCFMQHHRRFYTHHPVRSPDERQAYVQGKQIDERKE